jgi:hypothetical protein
MVIATSSRSRSIARRLMLVSALVVALSLAFTGAASAQTPFQATVSVTVPLPAPCSNGAFACGTADLAGYGAASYSIFFTAFTVVQTSCGSSYTDAIIDFTLASDPDSTLVLDESGSFCFPGLDGRSFFKEGPNSYGHPFTLVGSWTVDPTSTGQFVGLTGSGTDLLTTAGARWSGSYSGTLS